MAEKPAGSGEGTPPSPPATPRPIASADERSRPHALPPLPSAGASPLAPTRDRARSGSAPPPTPIRDERSRPHAIPPVAPPLPPAPRASTRADTEPRAGVAEHRAVRSPLVGRDDQLAVLRDVVGRAVDFQAPQLVTLVGNQGTGKTRLVGELERQLRPPVRVLHGRATAGVPGSALSSLLRDRFAVAGAVAGPIQIAEQVADIFGAASTPDVLHCLGGFLGVEFPASAFMQVVADNPRHKDDVARTILRRWLELDAGRAPLVLILDDLQAADDRTLSILTELAANLGGSPVVIIAVARPEMLVRTPGWGEGAVDHERIDLRNLEPDDAETMFGNLLAQCGRIPEELVTTAIELTGGNPLFLEQLVRLYLARGAIDATSGPLWRLDVDAALAIELPISVEEAIEARIAALEPDERDLLEKAAVFGNVFWVSAAVALTRLDGAAGPPSDPLDLEWGEGEVVRRRVSDLIYGLAERDYLLVLDAADSTVPGDVEVVFKHNLERELVVRATAAGRSARYHLGAAQWLEARLNDKSEEQLEFLTGLYERGGDRAKAARCYLLGADRARARYAGDEARGLYERGLALLGEHDAPAKMDALHNLGDVLDLVGESTAALERFAEMLALAWQYDNQGKAGAAHIRIARVLRRQGQYDPSMEHLRRASELFTRAEDERGTASTLDDMGRVHWLRGAYGQALDFHRQALAKRKAIGDRRSIALSLANIGRVHLDSGNFKAAMAQFREALDLRRDIDDRSGVVQSLSDLAGVHGADGNHAMALGLLDEARAIATEIGDKLALAEVLSRAGEHAAAVGESSRALADLARAKELARTLGDRVVLADSHRRAALAELARGDLAAAEREVRWALQIGESVGARVPIGAALRTAAAVSAAKGDAALADEQFRKSVDVLATMHNEIELARSYRAFAEFRAARGEATEAAALAARAAEVFERLRAAATTD
ncbi:MAG: tetratricopeptide repeat protein [Kofleriaceae bacterium]|nr:tetratricopeptide repeat protein [Kofleriaceae bacterium]MBP9171961.1 tetratricopeptide repeat protein [Kofleriaceae bacterium]MBP9862317.1 tetratricopeptide repeat protein [Kofleriaceae bacterium]